MNAGDKKALKLKVVRHLGATLLGIVLAGIVGVAAGEALGFAAGVLYLYGLHGHMRVVKLLEKFIK